MKNNSLAIEYRDRGGSSVSKRYRREGKIPVNISFADASSVGGCVIEKDFVHLAQASKYTDVIELNSEHEALNKCKVLVKDLQQDPIKGKVLHVDFQALTEGKEVKVKVPVQLNGTPEGVKTQGGILTQASQDVLLSCQPNAIPSFVEVDVTSLQVGERVLAEDVSIPEGTILKSNPRETIASVVASRTTRLMDAEEAKTGEVEVAGDAKEAEAATSDSEKKE